MVVVGVYPGRRILLNNPKRVSMTVNGAELVIETGRVAKQSNGSVMISHGDTVALVTACANKRPTDRDFLPLFVEYRERAYAAGKIPGGFFKRDRSPVAPALSQVHAQRGPDRQPHRLGRRESSCRRDEHYRGELCTRAE
jgi:hypothetical protein